MTMYTPDINNSDVFTALRSFLQTVLGGIEVVQGKDNQVPMPEGDFVLMTAGAQKRLATNIDEYTFDLVDGDSKSIQQKIEYGIQLDVYGANAANNAVIISSTLRDSFAYEQFPDNVKPLYCDDPMQLEFVNDQAQYERRFMIMAYLQFDPTVVVPAQMATELVSPTIYPV